MYFGLMLGSCLIAIWISIFILIGLIILVIQNKDKIRKWLRKKLQRKER